MVFLILSPLIVLFLASMEFGASPTWAADTVTTTTTTTDTDKKTERRARAAEADAIRKAAKQKAKSQIGYPDAYDVFVGGPSSSADFYTLSQQIARLAAFVRALSQTMEAGATPGFGGGADADTPAYGPEGPNAKSVRLILEYRLMVAGNPHLKVGKVTEDKEHVTAQVVTADSSLVDEYSIDKKTGVWSPVR
ncbi:MAG: hypothetical protein H8E94_08265 [Alphaproteobacteria bacterium]|nr:hypothetical protein [Alphaproteobacteria bacterium]